jgi:hypothetical protein
MPDYRSIAERAEDLAVRLLARCQIADPDGSLDLRKPAEQILRGLQHHLMHLDTGRRVASEADRPLLQLALLNIMLLEALSTPQVEQQMQHSALSSDDAEALAGLLASTGIFARDAYRWQTVGGSAVAPYLREAAKVSTHLGPISEAFDRAMQGDQVAAQEVLRLFEQFLRAADSGKVMPSPWTLDEEARQ